MPLLNYDLHDLHALLCFLRAEPEKLSACSVAVRQLAERMTQAGDSEPNAIRRILRPFVKEEPALAWALTDNVYTADVRVIRGAACPILRALLLEALQCTDDPARLTLLCDAAHNTPLLLAAPRCRRRDLDRMLRPYRRAYRPDFLRSEMKPLPF